MVESGLYGTPTTSIGRCWICKPGDPSSNPRRDIIFVSVTVIYNVRTTQPSHRPKYLTIMTI